MRINAFQVFVFICLFLPICLFIYSLFLVKELSSFLWGIPFIIACIYLLFRLLWLLGESEDNEIHFNSSSQKNTINGICPLCGLNKPNASWLVIGYSRRCWKIEIKLFLNISFSVKEITTRINICTSCKNKFLLLCKFKILSILKLNPSIKVLKRKLGYTRGLYSPYEVWHLS
jgi:hypothetical protein